MQIKNSLKKAIEITIKLNEAFLKELSFLGKQEFKNVAKKFIAPLDNNGIVKVKNGVTVWNISKYFLGLWGDKTEVMYRMYY